MKRFRGPTWRFRGVARLLRMVVKDPWMVALFVCLFLLVGLVALNFFASRESYRSLSASLSTTQTRLAWFEKHVADEINALIRESVSAEARYSKALQQVRTTRQPEASDRVSDRALDKIAALERKAAALERTLNAPEQRLSYFYSTSFWTRVEMALFLLEQGRVEEARALTLTVFADLGLGGSCKTKTLELSDLFPQVLAELVKQELSPLYSIEQVVVGGGKAWRITYHPFPPGGC